MNFRNMVARNPERVIDAQWGGQLDALYAADIEVMLLKHPDIIDVAVIGIPSDQWGESPMALCVRKAGSTMGEDRVKEWANGQLAKTQRLVAVEFRDSLPRSTIGKIMKRELREPYWAGRSARI